MFKSLAPRIFSFDLEWTPCPVMAERLHGPQGSPREAFETLWRAHPDYDEVENPRPFLKLIQSQVVSLAFVDRRSQAPGEPPMLSLHSLPTEEIQGEREILQAFLNRVGDVKPQLVGYNSSGADMPIVIQRAIATGVRAPAFCHRPNKPWEGPDYFARFSDAHVDLMESMGGFRGRPSLNELCLASGFPAKLATDGGQVAEMWLQGEIEAIVRYNRLDAIATHLAAMRVLAFAGHADWEVECEATRQLLRAEGAQDFLDLWAQVSGHEVR